MPSGRICRILALAALFVALGLSPAPARAATDGFSVLHDFAGTRGHSPNGALVWGPGGDLYGTLSGNLDGVDHGAIFRMTTSGAVSIIHTFSGPDGDHPLGLVAGTDGFLYGVTARGGTPTNIDCAFVGGCGTFFRMTATGVVTVLHNFNSGQDDGSWPNAGIVQGSDGAFYGTTLQGGGYGSAYRISATGGFALLHRFTVADGINPEGGLIQASDSNFYGVTNQYGPNGGGTVFRLDRAGNLTVVHGFGFGDGYQPKARLLQAADGFLYGTTEGGGPVGNGVVFRLRLDGTGFSIMHAFDQWGSDGFRPATGLIQGADGNFYGESQDGGLGVYDPERSGDVYRMRPDGTVSVLHTFSGPDGRTPSGLVNGPDGLLYGAALGGGSAGDGTLFRIDPSVPLPVASVTFEPNPMTNGSTATGTVTLTAPAPSGGIVVDLSTNNEGAAQVPRSVTVPGGSSSATFTVTSDFVIFGTASLLVFASVSGAGISAPLTVVSASPPPPPPSPVTIASLTLDATTIRGGTATVGRITLVDPAPPGGAEISLTHTRPRIVKMPSSITIGAGASAGAFDITTRHVKSTVVSTITASTEASTKSVQLTITP